MKNYFMKHFFGWLFIVLGLIGMNVNGWTNWKVEEQILYSIQVIGGLILLYLPEEKI